MLYHIWVDTSQSQELDVFWLRLETAASEFIFARLDVICKIKVFRKITTSRECGTSFRSLYHFNGPFLICIL